MYSPKIYIFFMITSIKKSFPRFSLPIKTKKVFIKTTFVVIFMQFYNKTQMECNHSMP